LVLVVDALPPESAGPAGFWPKENGVLTTANANAKRLDFIVFSARQYSADRFRLISIMLEPLREPRTETLPLGGPVELLNILSGAISARADGSGTMPADEVFPSDLGQLRPLRIQKQAFILTQWCRLSRQ
jgi:hypothetical protein